MTSISGDADLLARSVREPAVFAVVYERHCLAVRRYVVRRVGSGAGEDLAAEVFVRAFKVRERYRAQCDSALPWLLGVTNHVIADHRRAEQRRLKALQRLMAASPRPLEHEDRGLGAELVRELRSLSNADRDALLLVVWGELTYEEAAIALGVPIGTVSSRVARARRLLAAALDPPTHHTTAQMRTPEATRA